MNDTVVLMAVAVVGCAVAGYLTPLWVRLIPEPEPKPEEELTEAERTRIAEEGPKETYAAIAALPWLPVTAMVLSGLSGGVVAAALGHTWLLAGLLPLVPVCVALAVVDARTRLLPAVVVRFSHSILLAFAVAYAGLTGEWADLTRGLILMTIAFVFYFTLWFIHSAGMGYGDVRLSALLGLALGLVGVPQWMVGMYASFFLFGVPGLVLAIVRWDRSLLKKAFPFGPAMIVGALVGIGLGQPIVEHLVAG